MGLEHELKEIIEDGVEKGVEKGIVKAVEKLINKGIVAAAIHNSIQELVKVAEDESINMIKNLIFSLIKNMYGDINNTEIKQIINEIRNVDKLCSIVQMITESKCLDSLITDIKN